MEIIQTVLKNDNKTEIKYVYHISDIHIGITPRAEEYCQVFNNMRNKLAELVGDNQKKSLIIVTGNIVHNGTKQSSEVWYLTSVFLGSLSDIADVILIKGIHDRNMRHEDVDILSLVVGGPKYYTDGNKLCNADIIIGEIKHKIYHLKKTGMYRYQNIVFGVTDVLRVSPLRFNMIDETFLSDASQEKQHVIALYHGTINSEFNNSLIDNKYFNVCDFYGYDYVMLGGNHKFQYMDENKTMGYSGSLIQNSFDETIRNRGILCWNLKNGKNKYYEVPNDYGYCTIDIINGKMIETEIPKKPTIMFRLENTTDTQYKKIRKTIKQKYDVQKICVVKSLPKVRTRFVSNVNNQ